MHLKDIVERVISREIAGLEDLRHQFDIVNFTALIDKITFSKGKVIITGIGKSGIISRKIVASLCSIGISAVFLSSCEAIHGDMGVIAQNDLVIILSNSGEGKELRKIIHYCNERKVCIIGISRDRESYLIGNSDISIVLPNTPEVSDLAIPTTSSTMMLVFGDVLTMVLKEKIQLKKEEYFLYHPGGKIGLIYSKVKDVMVKCQDIPIVGHKTPLIQTIIAIGIKRLGFALVVDDNGIMSGIVNATDIKEPRDCTAFDLMTNTYKTISSGDISIADVMNDLDKYKQVIVVNNGKPEGVLTSEILKLKLKL